ncbi:carboxypeptidase-like regulatory domain-containing protein [Petrimonas sp.]|uniref:carboxypeptidase-like regulatory domain-containing protein n=1 Tax=Petrimonas sp. TaxID=2023866 RepID=UPI003F510803
MKLFLTILASVVISASVFAADKADNKKTNEKAAPKVEKTTAIEQVNGAVIDLKTNEALAGAAIHIDGNKIYSDLDGNFTLKNFKPGVYKIKVELISYEPAEMEINVKNDSKIQIPLVQQ